MPFAEIGDARLHYQLEGPEAAPWLVMSHSLGANLTMWDSQMPALLHSFRVLRYDIRGHGKSSVPPGPYSIEQLGADVLALLDTIGVASARFCGLSMSGMIALWLGINAANRFSHLVVANSAARIGSAETWNTRIAQVKAGGMKSIADAQMERWFTPEFRAISPHIVSAAQEMLLSTQASGYVACCAAIRDKDMTADLPSIKTPTLVIAGKFDPIIPPADLQQMEKSIPRANLISLDASHLSNLETPAEFNTQLQKFLEV
jgi:3-oxoadipate enol-lactonase